MGMGLCCPALAFAVVAAAPSKTLRPEEIFEFASPRTFVVVTPSEDGGIRSVGSAVVVGPALLVTNAHVVGDVRKVILKQGSRFLPGEVAGVSAERDVALIRVPTSEALASPPEFRELSSLRVGQRVFAVGSPGLLEGSFSDGLVAALRPRERYPIQTSTPISEGSSGGGLFDETGALTGIVSAYKPGGQNLNFAIPMDWVSSVMAQLGGGRLAEPPPSDDELARVGPLRADERAPEKGGADRDEGTPSVPVPIRNGRISSSGWQTLRWGQSPSVVGRALQSPRGPFKAKKGCALVVKKYTQAWRDRFPKMSSYGASCFLAGSEHAMRLAGAAPDLEFSFDSDGLSAIHLTVVSTAEDMAGALSELQPVHRALESGARADYGQPTVIGAPLRLETHKAGPLARSGEVSWETGETLAELAVTGSLVADALLVSYDLSFCPLCARARTPRGKWSKEGWQKFRWGMGPGDVEELLGGLRLVHEGYADDSQFGEGRSYSVALPERLYGASIQAEFRFGGERLYWIILRPRVAGASGVAACHAWLTNVSVGLRQKYGVALKRPDEDDSLYLLNRPTEVVLSASETPPSRESKGEDGSAGEMMTVCPYFLSYSDQSVSQWQLRRIREAVKKEANEKL